jgi:serine/threonine protein kinase
MSSGNETKRLQALAMDITDDRPIDWLRETTRLGQDDHLRAMQLIEEVFHAHHALEMPPQTPQPVLFSWGSLQVLERIGAGGFGDVYRAFDPRLQRTVALKLRKADAPASSRTWVEEARRLARVRHPHVLSVYGVEVHDDRAGIETEWIDGMTLERWLEVNGPASAAEATVVGVDLCRALAAVHREGLIHGDVKAANVMRERGGRLVLMDFGSARAGGGVATGTPLYTAPEVLRGEPGTTQSDLFSVGALLYRLVTGSDPFPATSLDELKEKHRTGAVVPLRTVRPDLPGAFVQAVMQALAVDPRDRVADVASFEQQLAARAAGSSAGSRRRRWLVAAAAVVVIAGGLWLTTLRDGLEPLIDVQQSEFVRVANGIDRPLPAHTRLAVGDHLALRFAADEDLHVYVLNEDATGQTYLLFPAPHVDASNPLAGGQVHRLPGTSNGTSFDWVVTSAGGPETFLVVAAREPVALLEAELRGLPPASPDREPMYAPIGSATLRGLRGLGGMAPSRETGPPGAGRLAELATALEGPLASPGIWVQAIQIGAP